MLSLKGKSKSGASFPTGFHRNNVSQTVRITPLVRLQPLPKKRVKVQQGEKEFSLEHKSCIISLDILNAEKT